MDEIVVGDVVELKSGSVQMTVGSIADGPDGPTASCVWDSTHTGTIHSESFVVAVLKKSKIE